MQHTATCPLCEATCGILVEVDDAQITSVRGDPDDPLSRGYLCPKAAALPDLIADPDRLRHPVKRTADGWVRVGWDEALDDIAARTHDLQRAGGPDSVATYLGNPNVHNLGAMLFLPHFLRTLRSRNRFSATSLDQLPHMLAASLMFGHELLMPVPDIDRTDLMVIVGGNPRVSNGSIMTSPDIRRRLDAVSARGRVVVIDPRRTETARRADAHHFIRPGTDALWLLGLLAALLELGPPQLHHLADHVDGIETIGEVVRGLDPARIADRTGVPQAVTLDLALALRQTPRAVLYGRLGACAQRQGGVAAWLVNVINAVSGHLDRPGGLMVTQPAVDALFPPLTRRRPRRRFGRWRSRVRRLPEFAGELPTSVLAEEIETEGEGQIRGLFVWAGNPVLSAPNGPRLDRALAGLDLLVATDLYITETSRHAHYVLPAVPPLARDHYDVAFGLLAVRNTAKFSPAVVAVDGDEREDWRIAMDLSDRLMRHRGAPLTQRLAARAQRRLGPRGRLALALGLGPRRLSLRRLRRHPHGIDLGPLTACLLQRSPLDRLDLAPAAFVADVPRVVEDPPDEGLLLIGRRQLASCNSWLHNSRRLVKGKPRCTLLIHPDDASARGLAQGDLAEVRSRVGSVVAPVDISDEVMVGVVSLPHGWGHGRTGVGWTTAAGQPGVSVNDLTDDARTDPLSGNAVLNGVPVEVRPG